MTARPRPFKCSAVISDVDGTLLTDDKSLTERTKAAVAALRSNGIVFSMISSRPPRGLRLLMTSLGIDVPVAGFNGGVLATADLAVISTHLLPPGVARRVVDFLDARRMFDGRPAIHVPSWRNGEDRVVSVAEIEGKIYSVVWMWRLENRRIISFRRAIDGEERAYRKAHG